MKIVKSKQTINPFGGINFVFETLDELGIDKILETDLPTLASSSFATRMLEKCISNALKRQRRFSRPPSLQPYIRMSMLKKTAKLYG